MKVVNECYTCLTRLINQASQLATDDKAIREEAKCSGMKVLDTDFCLDAVSIVIATKIHKAIRYVSGTADPYLDMKKKELTLARSVSTNLRTHYTEDLRGHLQFAALGNSLDFFRPLSETKRRMNKPVEFKIDHSQVFQTRLEKAQQVLYLADNAGEIFFDLPLLGWMRQYTKVIYVVKASPVQNDLTLEDVRKASLLSEVSPVITTGTATPGIDLALASTEFKQAFSSSDLIFAKGMGFYESLSELPANNRYFHCLMAKCQPVAKSIGVPLDSYVAMMR
ncbi:MAG: ARMT1-like domain-containing protein [Chloroflexota bacterium]|nr:ARMT1-like domain-containing protein [Chloroflexota bacterium]